MFRADPGYLSFAFAVGAQRIVTWQSVAMAAGAGLLAACVGVLAPLRDVLGAASALLAEPRLELAAVGSRVRAIGAARRCALALGGGCLAITTAILLARPQSAILGSVTLVAALLLLLPIAFDAILAGFEALQRPLYAASTRIAIVELRTPRQPDALAGDRRDRSDRGVRQRRDRGSEEQPAARPGRLRARDRRGRGRVGEPAGRREHVHDDSLRRSPPRGRSPASRA